MKKSFLVSIVVLVALVTACAPKTVTPAVEATAAPLVSAAGTQVKISGFAFDPPSITIHVGDTVTWTNQDSAAHTVVADDSSWTSERLNNGASFSHTFDAAGTFSYHCGLHSTMKGTVIVEP